MGWKPSRRCRARVYHSGIVAAAITLPIGVVASGQIIVSDETAASGISFEHEPLLTCLGPMSWMTGGAAAGDFNSDGYADLFIVGGGQRADALYINQGDGHFIDDAAAWGIVDLHAGNGVAVADFNNDGHLDMYVTSFGVPGACPQPGRNRLYRNTGQASFDEIAAQAGVHLVTTAVAAPFGAAWGDVDLDGDLDLFVCSWRDGPSLPNGGTGNRLFRNDGDETFTDITDDAIGDGLAGVWGFQPAIVDMNDDLYPELLVAADFETSRYLVNNGDGTFTDSTAESGTGLDDNGMGQAVGDFNGDGWHDWYVTSIHKDNPMPGDNPGNMLYINQGDHLYVEQSESAGVNDGGWGWAAIAVDLENDGWLDIVEVNGREGGGQWAGERGYLFHNAGDGSFHEIGLAAGFDHVGDGRGLAWLDADQDGRLDFLVTVHSGESLFYRNLSPAAGNWLAIELATANNPLLPPHGFGANVIATVGDQQLVCSMNGSPSYLATSELIVHLGVGAAKTIDELRIRWSRGYETMLTNVPVNQRLTVTAPDLADLNAGGSVEREDLEMLLDRWGPVTEPAQIIADLNNDGEVDVLDLLILLINWG